MTTRKYSSRSQQTSLTVPVTSTATSITVNAISSLLGGITVAAGETFTIVIDPDTALEEIVNVYSPSTNPVLGSVLTIVRGVDGSGVEGVSGQTHSAGAVVRHMAIGRDYRESNNHIESGFGSGVSTTAHGVNFSTVVKTSDTGTVSNAMIATDAVTTAKITNLNVTTAKIADSAITSAKIADLGIATGDIADLAITTGKIADSAITSAKIADLTIATGDIADSAITSAKIADGTIVAGDIADGAVTSAKILNDTIVNADISTSAQIAYSKLTLTNTILNADINASAAIEKTKISGIAVTLADTGTVTSTMITDGTIVSADISATAAIPMSKLSVDPTARANHTGTQVASTISDLDATIKSYKVTDLTAPTTAVSVNSQKITNLATPTASTDAATKAYADLMVPLSTVGVANGVAPLDSSGKVPLDHIPATAIAEVFVVSSEAAMLAISGVGVGDIAIRTDVNKSFILRVTPGTTLSNWNELLTPTDAVLSVDGQTGAVSLSTTYATVANAANKLPLAGGTMSGPIAMGTNKITGLGTPTTTGDAATKDYADTKLPLAGGTVTGPIAMSTNKITGLGDPTLAQDAATKNYIDTVVLAPSNLTGVITSVGNITSIASQTGTGTKFVVDTSPTLVTPVLGVATATSINGTTIPTSKTLVATDSTVYVVPSQSGSAGKYLTTDGTVSSWGTVNGYSAPTLGTTTVTSGSTVTNINGLTINSTTIPTSKTLVATDSTTYVVPDQTSNTGKYLTTNGTTSSWATVITDPTADIFMMMGA